jgi:hypothetical protein
LSFLPFSASRPLFAQNLLAFNTPRIGVARCVWE